MTLPDGGGGRVSGFINAVRGLTLTNVFVIILLLLALIPAYFVFKLLGDPLLLDRFLSHYAEIPSNSDCTIRTARQRGGPELWSVSQGFAFQGADKWSVSVILDHNPPAEEIDSYCAVLGLITGKMVE